jgi:hypothetical protein
MRLVSEQTGRVRQAVPRHAAPWRTWLDGDALIVFVLVALCVLAFAPWWAGGRIFAPFDLLNEAYQPWASGTYPQIHNHFTGDVLTQYLPYRRIAERSFAEDGQIGWSTLTFGGRPEYANTMAAYGDWTMQLHRFFDFWTAWHLGLLGQFLIAALGMYALLRAQQLIPLVALLGACAFIASSQIVFVVYHRWHLAAFAWVPWLLWAIFGHRSGRRWCWPLVPGFGALALVGGNLQTNIFVVLAVFAVWIGLLRQDARGAARLRTTGHMLLWMLLAAGLAGFALLPEVLVYLDAADLAAARNAPGYAAGPVQPLFALLLLPAQLFPTLLGGPGTIDLLKAVGLELIDVAYFGLFLMLLAYRGVLLGGVPATPRVLMAMGLLLPLTPFVGSLYHRVQLLFILGGIWAALWWWQHATERELAGFVRRVSAVLAVLGGLWLVASLLSLLLHDALTTRIESIVAARIATGQAGTLGVYPEWRLDGARRLIPELRIWHPRQLLFVGTTVATLLALHVRRSAGLRVATLVLVCALLVDFGAFTRGWVTTVDPARHPPYPQVPDLAVLQQRVGDGRVHIAYDGPPVFLPPNTLSMYGVAAIQQFETVTLHGMWSRLGFAGDALALGQMAVTHAVSQPNEQLGAGWTLDYAGDRLAVWRNDAALPHYLALSGAAADAWPTGGDVRHGRDPGALPVAGDVAVHGATMNRRALLVPAGTQLLRIAENWSEGWQARVGAGAWRSVAAGVDLSMVVPIPNNRESTVVELRYRPGRRTLGRWLTFISLLVTGSGALLYGLHGRRGGAGAAGHA